MMPNDKKTFQSWQNEEKNPTLITVLKKEQKYWGDVWELVDQHKKKCILNKDEAEKSLDEQQSTLFKILKNINDLDLKFLPSERET